MKKISILLLMFPILLTAQETSSEKKSTSFPQYQLFHMYMEYGSGELNKSKYGTRAFECLDMKATYNQNLPGAEWLSLGFVGQVSWNFGLDNFVNQSQGKDAILKKMMPSRISLSGTVGFINNIITLGVATEGTIGVTIYYNKTLPKVQGLYSHDFTFLFSPSFYMPGNQFVGSTLQQGWFDKLEMRIAYRMKFNKYVGLRPEFLFNFTGTDLLAGRSAHDSFMFRFNPRLQFYADQFSFFIEPRFFYLGSPSFRAIAEADKGFIWEIKVGFDITHFVFKNK